MPLSTGGTPAPQASGRGQPDDDGADVTIRRLESHADYDDACALQEEIWGAGFSERVPAAILMVAQKIGGVAAGAFTPGGRLVGFVFGLTGVRGGRLVHWSDMLAVRADARGRHLGDRLKAFQRDQVARLGVETMLWTFDPLVARNAHFNINRLGARPVEYAANLYGSNTGSTLHGDIPTDRLIVEWDVRQPAAPSSATSNGPVSGPAAIAAPTVNPAADGTVSLVDPLPDADAVRVQVPEDVQAVQSAAPDLALAWRLATREAFLHYLTRGYRVTGFRRGDGATLPFYALARPSSGSR